MTLTTAGKNWLAINAGVDNCFSSTGVTYQLPDEQTPRIEGTGDVLNAFFVLKGTSPNAKLIANTSYNEFKAINGGNDIDMDIDVAFAYANDGSGVLPAYCAPPANIISTELLLDYGACVAPCTINATVTWTNSGVSPGTFLPGVTVDNGTPMTITQESLTAGQFVTRTIQISGLTIGSHNICASPGIHCQSVQAFTELNICNWIISRGGWANISIYDIMTLIRAYLHITNLGFVVMTAYITGCVLYYLNNRLVGNSLTGCSFTS